MNKMIFLSLCFISIKAPTNILSIAVLKKEFLLRQQEVFSQLTGLQYSINIDLLSQRQQQNKRTIKMNRKSRQKKFSFKYPFLDIFEPKQNLNDSAFHFYTQPQPDHQKICLHRASSKKPLTMYYQKIDKQQYDFSTDKQITDTSSIIDFQYFSLPAQNSGNNEKMVVDKTKMVRQSEWVKKYEPQKFIQLLTDDKINRNLLTWLKSWDPIVFNKTSAKKKLITPQLFNRNLGQINKNNQPTNYQQQIFTNPKKMILLAGPPGCGKTTLVRVLANHCKYQIVQINASDDRSANNLIGKIEGIAGNDTIRGNKKPALICLDQIDGIVEGEASGITKVIEFIQTGKKIKKNEQKQQKQTGKQKSKPGITFTKQKKQSNKVKQNNERNQTKDKKHGNNNNNISINRPVIFICNDPFAKSLKQLRSKAHVVYFNQLNTDKVIKRMRQILQKEKVVIELHVLHKICQICKNDIRSCIGVLQLVCREKRNNNKNPKDIINKLKLSFVKDTQSSINDFIGQLFTKKCESSYTQSLASVANKNFCKYLEGQVLEIYNPSLLIQTFLNNFLNVQGITRKTRPFLTLYDDLIKSDILIKNGFKHNGQLQIYHVIPYLGFAFSFGSQQPRKIQFPFGFFEKVRKMKSNNELIKTIYGNIPVQLKIFISRQQIVGCYLYALFMSMQTSSTRQSQIIKCVSSMLTYGFKLRKSQQNYQNPILFSPEIDVLVTFGQRKPQILISNVVRTLMQQNYEFFKQRKEMLSNNQLKDNTTAMINQMHLQSRKKKMNEQGESIKYKFTQGTGTKISYAVSIGYFF